MKQIFILNSLVFFLCLNLSAQCPEGDVLLTSQAEVDSFVNTFPDCDSIKGNLLIGPSSDIDNLSGLSDVIWVEDNLVIKDNDILESLSGLENIRVISASSPVWLPTDSIVVENNDALINLVGLTNLTYLEYSWFNSENVAIVIKRNDLLTNLTGLESLSILGKYQGSSASSPIKRGGLSIVQNPNLTTLSGLENFTSGILEIINNPSLISFEGLSGEFSGNLFIIENNALSNLQGLEQIDVLGSLSIINNENLINLEGLDGLSFVSGAFDCDIGCWPVRGLKISQNNKLQDFTGLNSLTSIGGFLEVENNDSLVTFDGLESLEIIYGSLYITDNISLLNIENLINLDHFGHPGGTIAQGYSGSLQIKNNPELTSLEGLNKIDSLGSLDISGNDKLLSLEGLDLLTSVSWILNIEDNDSLQTLTGLDSLKTIYGNLSINDNNMLINLAGLSNLDQIGRPSSNFYWGHDGDIEIKNNDNLNNLEGLNQIDSVGNLDISGNKNLLSLDGFDQLSKISDNLKVEDNDTLTSLSGFENLTFFRKLNILNNEALTTLNGIHNAGYSSVEELIIKDCPNLSMCAVYSVCGFLENGGVALISENASGCNDVPEVEATCLLPIEEIAESENMLIFPNPVASYFYIQSPDSNSEAFEISIFDLQGKLMKQQMITNGQMIEFETFAQGFYILKIIHNGKIYSKKIVKA